MLRIAICDDDRDDLERIKTSISNYHNEKSIDINIYSFLSAEELLKKNDKYDIIFLDIEMEKINGIEAAQRIRELNMLVPIVYITSYSRYWRSAYKVHAFDFISKPFVNNDIYAVLDDFIESVKESNVQIIQINTEDGIIYQNINEICYILVKGRKTLEIGTVYNTYNADEFLKDLIKRINRDVFFQTHRSCYVNLKYVQGCDKDGGITTKFGVWLPLAEKKKMDFLRAISYYLRDRKDSI